MHKPEIVMLDPRLLDGPLEANDRIRSEEFLQALTEDIRKRGIQLPLIVTPTPPRFRIIAGTSRWLCALRAALTAVPAIIKEGDLTPGEEMHQTFMENEMRAETDPLTRMRMLLDLQRLNGWSREQLAKETCLSQKSISIALKILDDLHPDLLPHVSSGKLGVSVAYPLARLKDIQLQWDLAQLYLNGRLCRDGVESRVRDLLGKGKKKSKQIKGSINGFSFSFAETMSAEELRQIARTLDERAKYIEKHGLPNTSFPDVKM